MEIEGSGSSRVVHLDKKERFRALLTAAPGHIVIRVDTVTVSADSVSIDGNIKNIIFGWSDDRTGEFGFGGPEQYKELMPPDVFVAVAGLQKEITERAGQAFQE